jgi:DNA-binding transcriptional regulator/RsmH inhibitor MraZ
MKWLYVYREGKYKLISAKTRSWEKAEQMARELRDSFDPTRQLQRQLEAKVNASNGRVEIAHAMDQFVKEVARITAAVSCVGCRHSHLLQPGAVKNLGSVLPEIVEEVSR